MCRELFKCEHSHRSTESIHFLLCYSSCAFSICLIHKSLLGFTRVPSTSPVEILLVLLLKNLLQSLSEWPAEGYSCQIRVVGKIVATSWLGIKIQVLKKKENLHLEKRLCHPNRTVSMFCVCAELWKHQEIKTYSHHLWWLSFFLFLSHSFSLSSQNKFFAKTT